MANENGRDSNELLSVLNALERGDFSCRMTGEGEIGDTLNSIIAKLNCTTSEIGRINRELGIEGRFGGQAEVPNLSGAWKELVDGTNTMAANLTDQVRNISKVTTCISEGDFGREVTVGAEGEMAQLKRQLNLMRVQLNLYTHELSRIAREIGHEGMFGGQADVPQAMGRWQDLMVDINEMSAALTCQIRDFAKTSRGVAQGRPAQQATVPAKGETLELKEIINILVEKAQVARTN